MAEHVATQFQEPAWFDDSREDLLDEAAQAGWSFGAQRIMMARLHTREQLEFPISNVIREHLIRDLIRDIYGTR